MDFSNSHEEQGLVDDWAAGGGVSVCLHWVFLQDGRKASISFPAVLPVLWLRDVDSCGIRGTLATVFETFRIDDLLCIKGDVGGLDNADCVYCVSREDYIRHDRWFNGDHGGCVFGGERPWMILSRDVLSCCLASPLPGFRN